MQVQFTEQIKRFDAKYAALLKIRQTYESTWADIIDQCAPDLKGYLNLDRKDDGQRNDDVIYDGTPARFCMTGASGTWAAVSSPSRPWMLKKMRQKALNEVKTARQWLDDMTETDYDTMARSNIYRSLFTAYYHDFAIGTACTILDKDYENVINSHTFNVGEYVLGIDGNGKVDTVMREFKLTGVQLVDKFGKENVPEKVLSAITNDNPCGNEYTVKHIIEPDNNKLAPFKKPWLSAYWLDGEHNGTFLQLKGYNIKPFAAVRWYTNAGEIYGKMNPGRNALGNMKQLQAMVYDFHDALQKVINPALQGPAEALTNGQITAIPGTFNPINPTGAADDTLKPLYAVNPDLQTMWQAIQDKKDQIASDFFVDLFMAVSMRMDKDMTAQEVREIAGERMLALGPSLDNLHGFLNEITDIIYEYSMEAGLYGEPPEEVLGEEFNVDYISILAQAQKMVDLSRIDQVLFYANQIAGVYPQIIDKIDFDQVLDEVGNMTGAPSSIIRSDEMVAQMRDQAAQQAQMQQMAQAATVGADVAGKMAKMPMGEDNALSRMMEGMQ